jgi:hypothetical protein
MAHDGSQKELEKEFKKVFKIVQKEAQKIKLWSKRPII